MATSTDETPATPKGVKNARRGIPSPASSLPTVDSKPVKPSEKKGANAYCQSELASITISFRFVDLEGSYHLSKDIEFDGGMFPGAMTPELSYIPQNTLPSWGFMAYTDEERGYKTNDNVFRQLFHGRTIYFQKVFLSLYCNNRDID